LVVYCQAYNKTGRLGNKTLKL